jgi:hypothetical protein
MKALGIFSLAVYVLILVAAVLALLMPFFVLRIRNEIISMNKKMTALINILRDNESITNIARIEDPGYSGRMMKICPECGRKNRLEDTRCTNCGKSPI